MSAHLEQIQRMVSGAVEVNPEQGVYRYDRNIFTDEALFELELKHVFENNWIYLAHESQVAEVGDYYTTHMGRQPIIIARDKNGELQGLLNTCSHKGTTLCRRRRGNKTSFTCPFHGWTFSNDGRLLKARDQKKGGYPEQFNQDGSHDLKKVAKIGVYRGFIFGSLNPDVLPLLDYLGETTKVIDNIVDQAPDGLEVLRGSSTYTYDGNWKLTAENGADGYHVGSVHWNYLSTMGRRKYEEGGTQAVDARGWSGEGGFYAFDHGHIMLWTRLMNPEVRPVYSQLENLKARLGDERADTVVNQTRNLCLYPNVYLMDQFSTQIRVLRPLSVDKTEVTIYCFAPKGESAQNRATRIRQYEDFFNVSGMGTPDDLEEFKSCQDGFNARGSRWNDMSRGAAHWIDGADHYAEAEGLKPLMTGVRPEDEGLYIFQHKQWERLMLAAIEREQAGRIPLAQV